MMRRHLILILALCFGWLTQAEATVIGKSGGAFTIDGQPKFLQGISYYDCGNYHTSDIDLFASKGFNLIVCHFDDVLRVDANSLYNDDGSLKAGKTADFHSFANYADSKGIIVDFNLLYSDIPGTNSWYWLTNPSTATAVSNAITNAINEFETHTNVIFSVTNEHIWATETDAHSETTALMTTARAACATCLISFSSSDFYGTYPDGGHLFDGMGGAVVNTTNVDEEIAGDIDMILWHTERNSGWDTRDPLRAANLLSYLASIGQSGLPVLAEEPGREPAGGTGGLGSAAAYFTWFQNMKAAGVAGAVFHTNKGFDLDPDSMMTQIGGSGVEYDVIYGLSAALAETTTSPISVSAVCAKVHAEDQYSISCTLPHPPVVGDVVIVTVNVGQYYYGLGSCQTGMIDSQNELFHLAAESQIATYNQSLIWYRPITTAPSGSYSVTLTCSVQSWFTISAAIVHGLVPSIGAVDVVGVATDPANPSFAVSGFASMVQSNELLVAVVSEDTGGAGTAITETPGWTLFHEHETCSIAYSGHMCGSSVYKIVTTPQAVTHGWSFAASVDNISGAIASFRGLTGNAGTIIRTLSWIDNATNETYYLVQKRTDLTYPTWVDVAQLPPNTQSYLATILDTETGDCWRVAAVNPYGTSFTENPSESCPGTSPPPPPPPPPPHALQIGGLQTLIDDELL